MSSGDIDAYLAKIDEPKRTTLEEMRRRILEVVPDAEQGLSYSVPAFKVQGTTIAGLAAFSRHLSYLPHSGSVLAMLGDEVADFDMTKGALHFAIDEPLPQLLIEHLITRRLEQAGLA